MRRDTFYPQLALLQLGADGRYALVDTTAFDAATVLAEMLDRHQGPRVMHSPSEDLEALAPLLPDGLGELFDTQLAAAFCGYGLGLSYRALVETFCGVQLDKGETRSDWLQRPLSPSQKTYATLDVVYLQPIYEALHARLQANGRLEWLRQDCQRLLARNGGNGDDQPQRDFRGAAEWPRAAQARLRRILLWRDATARQQDTPRPWLFDDAMAMRIIHEQPQDDAALAAITRGRRAMRSAQRQALLALLQRPPDAAEIDATASIPAPPRDGQKKAIAAMRHEVDACAQHLDIPPGLLAPRKLIERLVTTGQWPQALEGWRAPLLRERLMRHMPA